MANKENHSKARQGLHRIVCRSCGETFYKFFPIPSKTVLCKNCTSVTTLNIVRSERGDCSKCGGYFKHWTNDSRRLTTIQCQYCDAPIDLELTKLGTYQTL